MLREDSDMKLSDDSSSSTDGSFGWSVNAFVGGILVPKAATVKNSNFNDFHQMHVILKLTDMINEEGAFL